MAQFSKGDIVCLKSGSPKMTIVAVLTEDAESQQLRYQYIVNKNIYGETPAMYICTWFDGIKDKEHLYPEEALELAI